MMKAMKKYIFFLMAAVLVLVPACDDNKIIYDDSDKVAVTDVILNRTTLTLGVDGKQTLTANVLPENATTVSVTWSSDKTDVATVSPTGEITAIAEGSAIITVKTDDGGKMAECIVTVVDGVMQIIMTTAESAKIPIHIVLFGFGEATIDWGDGTIETFMIKYDQPQPHFYAPTCQHSYSDPSPHTIIITGKNITGMECTWKGIVQQLPPNIPITSIYISENSVFRELYCNRNQLTSLDVSGCAALTKLDCSWNKLTSLNISKNLKLESLYCSYNQLSSLDVSKNVVMKELGCSYNKLTNLNVIKNSALTTLRCSGNQLTNLNVSGLNELLYLYCERNFMDADALNILFKSLNTIPTPSTASMYKQIWIGWNGPNYDGSGTEKCDPTIAKGKKWTVIDI